MNLTELISSLPKGTILLICFTIAYKVIHYANMPKIITGLFSYEEKNKHIWSVRVFLFGMFLVTFLGISMWNVYFPAEGIRWDVEIICFIVSAVTGIALSILLIVFSKTRKKHPIAEKALYFIAAVFGATMAFVAGEAFNSRGTNGIFSMFFIDMFSAFVMVTVLYSTVGDSTPEIYLAQLYIIDADKNWYIYYKMDDDKYLCGNDANINKAKEFRVFDEEYIYQRAIYKVDADAA